MTQQPQFLAPEIPDLRPEECRFHVIPAPLESSVSYGGGTAAGPAAIIEASIYLEAYDGHSCPCKQGIWTADAVDVSGDAETVLDRIADVTADALRLNAVPVILGGEHTVTLGAIRAFRDAGLPIGVIQFDAHSDLRDTYHNNRLSHACVMRRVAELGCPICQVGVRAISEPELAVRHKYPITVFDAEQIYVTGHIPELPANFPKQVYVTFDVDGFDASLMPATGTPEPGGLDWWTTMTTLHRLLDGRQLVGFDVVELAPIPTLHAPNFTAARLVYNLMGMA